MSKVSRKAFDMNKVFARKLSSLTGIELICEFLRTMLNHNQVLLSIVSYSFYLFGEFEEVANLHSRARALSCPSRCQKHLTKYFFAICCAEMLQQFAL